MFEHTKQLENLNTAYCDKIAGKNCREKFFAEQSQGSLPELSSIGDIEGLANFPSLIQVDFDKCQELTGKETFFKSSLETSTQEFTTNFLRQVTSACWRTAPILLKPASVTARGSPVRVLFSNILW